VVHGCACLFLGVKDGGDDILVAVVTALVQEDDATSLKMPNKRKMSIQLFIFVFTQCACVSVVALDKTQIT